MLVVKLASVGYKEQGRVDRFSKIVGRLMILAAGQGQA
jgi:hypothetical protein